MIIRQAEPGDVAAMAAVESASWPGGLAASDEQIRARLQAYREGQWIALHEGRIVAVAASQRITSPFLAANQSRYDLITDGGRFTRSHHPDGEIFQLIGVGVAPEGRGLRLGRLLVDREIDFARALPGIRRIVGFTRPAGYHRHRELTIEEYINRRDAGGELLDPVVAFHLNAGARIVSLHPNFREADSESEGYGILIEYA